MRWQQGEVMMIQVWGTAGLARVPIRMQLEPIWAWPLESCQTTLLQFALGTTELSIKR
jgi:hypothetical protein